MHAGVGVLDNSPLLIGVAANLSVVRGDKGRKRIILTLHTVYPTWTLLWLTMSAMQGRICCCRGKPMGTNDRRSAHALTSPLLEGQTNKHQRWEECTCTHVTIAGGANQRAPATGGVHALTSPSLEEQTNSNLKHIKMLVKKRMEGQTGGRQRQPKT